MKAEPQVIREVEKLVEKWNEAVGKGTYAPKAKKSYIGYINMFLNFTKDEFTSEKIYDPTAKPKPKKAKTKPQPSQRAQSSASVSGSGKR